MRPRQDNTFLPKNCRATNPQCNIWTQRGTGPPSYPDNECHLSSQTTRNDEQTLYTEIPVDCSREIEKIQQNPEWTGQLTNQWTSTQRKKTFFCWQLHLAKERRLTNHYKCITMTGRKLNVEEFPDIPGSRSMNLERETSRRDEVEGWKAKMLTFVERPAGRLRILSTGIQSHPITPWQFISCCRQQEENGRCMFGLLYLAPENFSISLSCCYNYTQNFTKGTY